MAFAHPELDALAVYRHMYRRGWFSALTAEPPAPHLMLSPVHEHLTDEYLGDLDASCRAVAAGSTERVGEARYS